MTKLPIDTLLPELGAQLREHGRVVLEAPPGAGKTTRVPRWLLEQGLAGSGQIVVTEPRRVAARLVATHVAKSHGEKVGSLTGYTVRFENRSGPETRIRYVTEGVLLRQLGRAPTLPGVSVVVIDEVHERHLDTDLLLALLWRLQRGPRPDLRLVVMSATLEAAPIAALLGGCPRLASEGKRFAVTLEHLTSADERPLAAQVASAVRKQLREGPEGDILVFLPGGGEIRAAGKALENLAAEADLDVVPLHGSLSLEQQSRALALGKRRKVVLSTNVAESSVTVPGVSGVIDSGLARVARHSPWSGVVRLELSAISRASATQRAGRAGREREGRVQRLFTRGDLERRPEHDKPEIQRAELAGLRLILAAHDIHHHQELSWLSDPPPEAVQQAELLLRRLGALEPTGALTSLGRRLHALPLPPRLGRVLLAADEQGIGRVGARVVALLSERDIRASTHGFARGRIDASGPSDALELLERLREADGRSGRGLHALGLDARALAAVRAATKQLARLVSSDGDELPEDELERCLARALLAGFGDQIARRRGRGRELTLSNGLKARLSEQSVVHSGELLLALDAGERPRVGIEVRLAVRLHLDWILEDLLEEISEGDTRDWNPTAERVERVRRLAIGSVTLEETRAPAPRDEETTRELVRRATSRGIQHFDPKDELGALVVKLELLGGHGHPVPDLSGLSRGRCLEQAAEGLASFGELRELNLSAQVLGTLAPELQGALRSQTPDRVTLSSGRQLDVHYEEDGDPWVESWLQDFFGQIEGPTILAGQRPLTLRLLAPNRRPVQVTRDLAGFWERHYPELRRALSRRYPRHAWPEDPLTATPPEKGGRLPRRKR